MSESKETRDLCAGLQRCNAMTFAVVGNMFAPKGWPDRYIHHSYFVGWVEFKKWDGKLDKIQAKRVDDLNDRIPGSAFVARHWEANGVGQIENTMGEVLGVWDSPLGFLLELGKLSKEARDAAS